MAFSIYLILLASVLVVECQLLSGSVNPYSMCTTDTYRDLPLNMQNEHQCLMMEQFNHEFFHDREDRIRRYKELNQGLNDISYKLDRLLSDFDLEYFFEQKSEKDKQSSEEETSTPCTGSNLKMGVDLKQIYRDCYDWKHVGNVSVSGVYPLQMITGDVILAHCDMETSGGGWTIIQNRIDGSVNFTRNWTEYKHGFGNPNSEHWLGLENIHQITANRNTSLRVDIWDWENNRGYAEYITMYLTDETSNYTLLVDGYKGDIGDSLSYHNNCSFSTPERDNDKWVGNCAWQDAAGWWYKGCSYTALNSAYHSQQEVESSAALDGIFWYHWKETYTYPLPRAEMKIRPPFA